MTKRIYAALVSLVAVVVALVSATPTDASAIHDGHQHQVQQRAARRTHKRARSARQRARASRRDKRRAVAYVCPMHADIRERSRGTCPKCLMDLVAEPRDVKTGKAGAAASGDM